MSRSAGCRGTGVFTAGKGFSRKVWENSMVSVVFHCGNGKKNSCTMEIACLPKTTFG